MNEEVKKTILTVISVLDLQTRETNNEIKLDKIIKKGDENGSKIKNEIQIDDLDDILFLTLSACDALINARCQMLKNANADYDRLEEDKIAFSNFFSTVVERNQQRYFPEAFPTAPDWVREYLNGEGKEADKEENK